MENENKYFDITIDKNFIANALTSAMQMNGDLEDREYITVEYIEIDGDFFNLIVKRNHIIVN